MGIIWKNWTRRNYDWWFGVLWSFCHGSAIALDVYMVLVLGIESISSRIWRACEQHDTLIAAGMLATVGIAFLVRRYRWMVLFTGIMGGHLFTHG